MDQLGVHVLSQLLQEEPTLSGYSTASICQGPVIPNRVTLGDAFARLQRHQTSVSRSRIRERSE
jgi:hypothetical protein